MPFHSESQPIVVSYKVRSIFLDYSSVQILVLSTNTQELVASFRVTTGTSNTTAIKSIEFARKGR